VKPKESIEDRTENNLVNLRRVIINNLTIMNAWNYEEVFHKLLKIELQEGGYPHSQGLQGGKLLSSKEK
jgi:hypothetical protein